MRHTAIKIISAPPRMMTKAEAAEYCARSIKRFEVECPVAPIRFSNGDLRWDVRDLDGWIDSLKEGHDTRSVEEIVGRLG